MRVVAAYLLAVLGGKSEPTADDINKILSSVGIEAKKENIDKLLSELHGKNLEEVLAEGSKKLLSLPSGGSAPVASSSAASDSSASSKKETKEEKKKEEPKEEEDEDMGFGLFD